jgi:YegS/Rv2252/BmrU family lipid kinase
MSTSERYGFIFNPEARHGTAKKFVTRIRSYLQHQDKNYSFVKTTAPLEAMAMARELSRTHSIVAAIGGDGTINEVTNGLLGTDCALALVPLGSGNDLNKVVGMPVDIDQALEAVFHGTKKAVDVGEIEFKRKNQEQFCTRVFVNSLGIGIDAEIAKEIKRTKYLNGLGLYLYAAIKVLSRYRTKQISIRTDAWKDSGRKYMICVGNGSCEGGGFKFFPDADPADGLLDVCVVPKLPIYKILPLMLKFIKGTHTDDKRLTQGKIQRIEFLSEYPFSVHADGEFLGNDITSIKVEVLPRKLNLLFPAL